MFITGAGDKTETGCKAQADLRTEGVRHVYEVLLL